MMQFIRLADETGRHVWVNLEAVETVKEFSYSPPMGKLTHAGRLTLPDREGVRIAIRSGDIPVLITDPAEIERLKGILCLIAGDPTAKVGRFRALIRAKVAGENEKENPKKRGPARRPDDEVSPGTLRNRIYRDCKRAQNEGKDW